MSKYDFGYELQEGTTNKWAYDQVAENTKVLEIGSSIGCLTFNLSKSKKCKVDIVEIDEESGARASEFATTALLGMEVGNLNRDSWYESLKGNKYDYIIALDVLEHLENPEHVLSLLKCILNENGKIILSIPNITHNAIILELLNNKFTYSDLGLLDRTHIHFFAYESIIKMISENGLHISVLDAIKKNIVETEFLNNYQDIPADVEGFLRTRANGDVYQYLLVLEQKEGSVVNLLGNGIADSSYFVAKVLVDGLMKNQITYPHMLEEINIDIDMTSYPEANSIRFIPVEQQAIIFNLDVKGIDDKNNEEAIFANWTSGQLVNDRTVILLNNQYEINFQVPQNIKQIHIKCNCVLINVKIADVLYDVFRWHTIRIEEQKATIEEQKATIEGQSKELKFIKDTLAYKFMSPFIRIERKVVESLWKK